VILDSNVIIYAAAPEGDALRELIARENPSVSAISVVEVLGFHRLQPLEKTHFEKFFAAAEVLAVDQAVIDRAVTLRQQRKMGLGDALIAATALVHGHTLVTRNTTDFAWVSGLTILNPMPADND
jgi:predicted nucleic acid-binding protein